VPTYAFTQPGFREDFEADTDADAERIATDMLRSGEYEPGDPPSTFRVEAHVTRLGPGGFEEDGWSVQLDIDPDEPPCPVRKDAGHDWTGEHRMTGGLVENPGVFSSGHGQIRTVEACLACGARKTDDLGGTEPASGDCMRVLTYEPPGTVDPPGMPVYWSVVEGGWGGANAVEPEPAGVGVPDDVAAWAASHGLHPDNPNVYLLVATEDEAQNDLPGEIDWMKGTVSYAGDMAIRAALAAADAADAEHRQHLSDTYEGT